MLIRLGYDIEFDVQGSVPIVAMLNVHSSRVGDLREPDFLQIEPRVPFDTYVDSFGN
ncbi:MAG: transglutaminase family protein, partial [Acidobacteriaceae bacterium]|nr:transglutaminase family protein [Acidobacteriaceae bacterium]